MANPSPSLAGRPPQHPSGNSALGGQPKALVTPLSTVPRFGGPKRSSSSPRGDGNGASTATPTNPSAASASPTSPGPMYGLYDHHRPQQMSNPSPGYGIPANSTVEDEEGRLVTEIGQFIAPRADGTVITLKHIEEKLKKWNVEPVKRGLLLDTICGSVSDKTTRLALLKEIHHQLEEEFLKTQSAYGPTWLSTRVQRLSALESHPIFVFSLLVEAKTKYAATAYIRNASFVNYIPHIKNVVAEQAKSISHSKRSSDVAKMALDIAKKAEEQFDAMRDKLLEESFPVSGIDLPAALRVVVGYLKKVQSAPIGVKEDIEQLHTKRTPVESVLRSLTGEDNPPWATTNTNRAAIDNERPAIPRTLELPISDDSEEASSDDSSVTLSIPPNTAKAATAAVKNEANPIAPRATTSSFLYFHTKLIHSAGLEIPTELDRLLERAVSVVTGEAVGNINSLENALEPSYLPLGTQFNTYVRGIMYGKLTKQRGHLYLDPSFVYYGGNVENTTSFIQEHARNIPTKDKEEFERLRLCVLLTPYIPATLHTPDNEGMTYLFNTDEFTDKQVEKSLYTFYTELDAMLLNPGGDWKVLGLHVPSNNDENHNNPTTFEHLERVSIEIETLFSQKDPDSVEIFKRLMQSIRRGAQFTTLMPIISEFSQYRDKELGVLFAKEASSCNILEAFLKELDTSGKSNDTKLLSFPIQYHIDARFTLLYVVLRYDCVRRVLAIAIDKCGEKIKSNVAKANAHFIEAMEESLANSVDPKNDVANLGVLRWSLLPENSGIIAFDPLVSINIDSAWAWIMKHATGVPWHLPDFVNVLPMDIIEDMSNIPMALRLKNYLADVVTLQFGAAGAHNTTQRINTASQPQLRAGVQFEADLIVQSLNLRAWRDSAKKIKFTFDSRMR